MTVPFPDREAIDADLIRALRSRRALLDPWQRDRATGLWRDATAAVDQCPDV